MFVQQFCKSYSCCLYLAEWLDNAPIRLRAVEEKHIGRLHANQRTLLEIKTDGGGGLLRFFPVIDMQSIASAEPSLLVRLWPPSVVVSAEMDR
jgi:hypothetical protein